MLLTVCIICVDMLLLQRACNEAKEFGLTFSTFDIFSNSREMSTWHKICQLTSEQQDLSLQKKVILHKRLFIARIIGLLLVLISLVFR